ncbi:MAG: sec-independent protein translocase protein TatC [Solirubrobacteraceae bacterium]|nr:sec-independent protein translocase protein TatC [Solirubrobacteraceae bacterium]
MPPTGLRPIGHEDKLTLVDHLTELRKRLLISAVTLVAAFSFCFWQNNAILDIVTKPVRNTQNLQDPSTSSKDPLEQAARFQKEQGQALRALGPALSSVAKSLDALGGADNITPSQRATVARSSTQLATASKQLAQAAAAIPQNTQRNLVTLGVTEPFTATITIAFYASLLIAMPMLLFQAYAFVLPAFSPGERKVALPLMLMVPVLFVMGAAFGYFVVLERAVQFLQNFNDDSFDILLQAKDYFKFAVLFVAGVGVLFQIPVGVLAVTRMGIFTPQQLAKNRGYVILGIAVLAAVATPTPDPFTMSLAMAPLVVLFELSIVLARWIGRIRPIEDRAGRWDDDDEDDDDGDDEPDDDGPPAGEPDGFDDEDDDGPDGRYDEDDDEPHLGIRAGDPDGLRGDLTKLGGPDRKD